MGATDPVRRGALTLLCRHEAGDGYANLLSDGERLAAMTPQDRALLTALFYGTVERRLALDYYIGVLAARSAASLTPHTRAALRLGLYQLLYMEIAPYAAVDTTVALGRDKGERSLLNAVLRAAVLHPERLVPPARERDLVRHLSIAFSLPAPTVRYFLSRLGEEEGVALFESFNRRPPLFLRINTERIERKAYLARLCEAGIAAVPDPLAPHGVRLPSAPPVATLPGYDEGLFFVQDAASQLASEVLAPREGDTVLDLCACPGGKSFGAALLAHDRARVLSRDLHESKLPLITEGARRLGLSSVTAECRDAVEPDPALRAACDRVICDVPCSGLGVIAKKPDLRYRPLSSVGELAALGQRILASGAEATAHGGVMVFSTCTLTNEENEDAVRAFLAGHPDFLPEEFVVGGLSSEGGMLTLWPHRHGTDGFFMAKFRRT